jgi:hypothetical protein
MSKKVTAVRNAATVEGNWMCLASDGSIRMADNQQKKGVEVTNNDIAITKEGMAAIKKAAVILMQIEKLKDSLSKIKTGKAGDYGEVMFEDESGEPAVRVGCTAVYADQLAGYIKALGL